jgi:ATP-dependent DNA ligase
MTSVIDILEILESDNSRLFKEEILETNRKNDLLRAVFKIVGDPYTNFYISKFKMPSPLGIDKDDVVISNFLNAVLPPLMSRQLTGHDARDHVVDAFSKMDKRQQRWCQRLLLKNLRCGVSTSTVNKVWPGTIVGFSVQLAETLKTRHESGKGIVVEDHIDYPVRVEPKLDGLRCVAVKHEGEVTMYTRSGSVLETLPKIKSILQNSDWNEFVLDGEIMGADWNETASVAMSYKRGKDDSNMVFHVFDAIPFADWHDQETQLTLTDRTEVVEELVKKINNKSVTQVQGRLVNNIKDLLDAYRQDTEAGYEGIMVKDLDSPYVFKRSDSVRKMKPVTTYEGVVVGHYQGNLGSKREGMWGGFEVVMPNGIVTRVGGGYTDAVRAEIDLDPDSYVGRIVEVEGQPDPLTDDGLTRDGKVRFPVFVRFRDNRDVDSKVLEAAKSYVQKAV